MCCRTCFHCTKISMREDFKKTDDGGVNWKYNYIWTINCKKNGRFIDIVEGTANMCKVPTCSLWSDNEDYRG